VPPERRPRDLTAAQLDAIADAIVTITRRAYRTGGITNDPDDVRRAKAEGAKRREYRHFVFGRDGWPCRACGVRIRREEHAGRRWYGCPCCQPAGTRGGSATGDDAGLAVG
jgi:endonuclease VIII